MTTPTHIIISVNRETYELSVISAHDDDEAKPAFENLGKFAATSANDVHLVRLPTKTGFVASEVESVSAGAKSAAWIAERGVNPAPGTLHTDLGDGPVTLHSTKQNGVHQNNKGEYVQMLADGSEIISSSDFSD